MVPIKRKIAIPDFYGVGKHIYEDELGWRLSMMISKIETFNKQKKK